QVDPYTVGLRSNDQIQKVNQGLRETAKKEKLDYIDLYSALKDDQGNLKAEYTVDGLHLSDAGYQVVQEIIEPYLDA
uniref:GDSL-type esterase/lipase family protein n=1 Tax=uncultured Faecalicoccus sp. TaxID=1971760 RepID=UPI0025F78691